MKGKLLSILLVLAMVVTSGGNHADLKPVIAISGKKSLDKQEYILTADNSHSFNQMKEKMNQQGKRVVRHDISDEQYLEDFHSLVVEMTEEEVAEYEKEKSISVEKDQKLTASNEVSDKSSRLGFIAEEVPLNQYETEEEYSDNPYHFKPCKDSSNKKENREIVPWNISCVAGTPHENKYKGKNIKVAVIDSGIDTHDELNTKGWVDFSDTVHGYKPTDNSGHGTAVAGVIAGRINGIGMEGIASDADIYSVKVLDMENAAPVSAVVKAIQWCIENEIDIINMSFGMDTDSVLLHGIVEQAYDKGILMIAAAGNDTETVQYPAAYPQVMAVGSVGEHLEISDFSCRGGVEVVAPGENAQTTGFVGSYMKTSGTSIAAAHVTGVAAAVKSARHSLSGNQLRQAIVESATSLSDGNRLVNYENAVRYVKKKAGKKISVPKLKQEMGELAEDKDSYVEGSWSSSRWNEETVSGHYSMINNMELSYFSVGAANDTQKVHHRWIVANSAYRTDIIEPLSSKGSGNYSRNANGEVLGKNEGEKCYSPYHAKSQYDMTDVLHHLRFLYELARRRLVLNSPLNLTATDYSGNSYYGAVLEQKMKRRIIVDMNVLYQNLEEQYENTQININTTYGKGYMVLGVFLHLVQDMEAHRAKVSKGMVFSGSSYNSYYTADYFGASMGECRIKGNNILGNPETGNASYSHACMMLYVQLTNGAAMPVIRLKDYLKNNITIVYNNKIFADQKASQAYEDNPHFASYRFSIAQLHSKSYINQMLADTGTTSSKLNYYFTNSANPLYEVAYGEVIIK